MCGNDRDVVSIRNTFLVRDSIREVARNMIIYRECADVRLVWGSLRLAPIIEGGTIRILPYEAAWPCLCEMQSYTGTYKSSSL